MKDFLALNQNWIPGREVRRLLAGADQFARLTRCTLSLPAQPSRRLRSGGLDVVKSIEDRYDRCPALQLKSDAFFRAVL
jgi:hypothetical protein